ncbi:internal scaffolding protein [Microviridae sp.]|nr:internal scaffolding protein [Microviridae sp.]
MERTVLKTHERNRVAFETKGHSLTHQSHAKECDINQIMMKWQKTGVMEHRNTFEGQYADFTETPQDYHEAMNQVLQAQEMFESLPSSVRRRFANDPGTFVDFVGDPQNVDEMIKLGLATKRDKEPSAAVIEPVDPAPKPKKEDKSDAKA